MVLTAAEYSNVVGGLRIYGRIRSEEEQCSCIIHCDTADSRPMQGGGVGARGMVSQEKAGTGGSGSRGSAYGGLGGGSDGGWLGD